jgi:glycosyltransferase involved in cell wall biosynthesis
VKVKPQPQRPLTVALDVWAAGRPNPTGLVTLRRQYARACALLARRNQVRICYAGAEADRTWLVREGLLDCGTFRRFRIPGRLQRQAARMSFLPVSWLFGQPEIYHSFTPYPFISSHTQVVGTLIDFVPMRLPESVPLSSTLNQVRWCQWATGQPDARWIAALARLRSDQVQVVELCAGNDMFLQPSISELTLTLKTMGIRQPYLLCVNSLGLRKNHIRLLRAWEQGAFANQGWTLVLVGNGGVNPLSEKLSSGALKGVIWMGYVPAPELVHLYYGCEAVVYPSLYEGFGIPVAEAIVAGKAVLTSHRSPMADIAGQGAISIDPWDTASLARGLAELVCDRSLRQELADYNWGQRQRFSIERLAEDLFAAYQAIADDRRNKGA